MLISIRRASEGDLEAVRAIFAQVQDLHVQWRPDIYRPNPDLVGEERFLQQAEAGLMYVAEVREEEVSAPAVAGVLEIQLRHVENPAMVTRDVIFVDSMAVDESYRGRGIGHAFFEFLKKMRDEGGYDGIELQVNARNRAAYEMYTKCGFREKSINMELVE